MFRKTLMILAVLLLPVMAFGQVTDDGKPVKVFTDADMVGTVFFSSDTVYNLSGFVFVEDGEVLIIDPGTVIKGDPGQAENATALVVARGGKIYAEGTAENPIVFTSISDDVDIPNDIPFSDAGRGLWGGLIILGYAPINTTAGVGQIEGIPVEETRGAYGGTDEDDNSGILKYVSVRHGGSEIGAANEINGVTFGAVGRGTVVDHIEVIYNLDDGYEWFGGTVNATHLVAAFCGDDSFDYDEGWRGAGQFWFTIQGNGGGDRGGEHDGGTSPEEGLYYASPLISNVTYIGKGDDGIDTTSQRTFAIRDNAAVGYYNSIFTDFDGYGVSIENNDTKTTDSRDRLLEGGIKFFNNMWYGFSDGNTAADITNSDTLIENRFFANGNDFIADPVLAGVSRSADGNLDPRPTSLSSWTRGWVDPMDATNGYDPEAISATNYSVTWPAFETVTYPGAFDPSGTLWINNWTALDAYGYITHSTVAECDCPTDDGKSVVVIDDASIVGTTVLSRDTVYNLDGFVYVEDGDTLIIEPGTILKGNPGQAENATALVVAQGGRIYALGASDCPVVITSISDDVDLTNDIPFSDAGRGLWGGVILLGNATINTTAGVGQIEGIPVEEPRGAYGGSNDDDNSGVFKYVSVRHGGSEIGAANEINGVTFGAVGRGTIVNHVEVLFNLDDGYEWFGGTVNTSHLIAAFCGDDCFDYDEGFRGAGQFWFAIQGNGGGDRGGEHDGGTSPEEGLFYASPLISNVTYIGKGDDGIDTTSQRTFAIRDNAACGYYNSIFADFDGYGVSIENNDTKTTDSRDRLLEGGIKFFNNMWYSFSDGNTAADITNGDTLIENRFFANGNDFIACMDMAISRTNDGSLDPRPEDLTAWTRGWVDPMDVTDGYDPEAISATNYSVDYPAFAVVDYPGAFDPSANVEDLWLANWSFLYCGGFIGDAAGNMCSSGGCCVGATGDINGDGGAVADISDLLYLVDYMFTPGAPVPPCLAEGDVNGSGGAPDISDLLYLVDYMFTPGSPAPVNCL